MENEAFRPLTDEEKLSHFPSGVFASGEALFYDISQTPPINETYPSPAEFNSASGIYATYAKNDSSYSVNSSIFGMVDLESDFSNSLASITDLIARGITDFSIFNPYIHYYSVEKPIGSVVPYPVVSAGTQDPIEIEYNFGVLSTSTYSIYSKGKDGTYLRSSRESWNVETSGHGPPVQPNWPPASDPHSGTGNSDAPKEEE